MEETLLNYLLGLVGPWGILVVSGLGGLVVIGQVVVGLTPSTKDDEAWEKLHKLPVVGNLLKAIANFAPIQKKPKQ